MNSRGWIIAAGVLVAGVFVLSQTLVVVGESEVAVRTTFGRPDPVPLAQAGLYPRWPWPVQHIHRFDRRVHLLEGSFEQVLTGDGRSLVALLDAGWRIADPVLFLERVGTPEQARRNLDGLIGNARNGVLGRHTFAELINTDPAKLKFDQVEQELLAAVRPEARARYGIEVAFVGLRRLALPEAITERVFDRQRAERREVAERYRAEGESEARRIRAEAESQRDQQLATADAEARRLRAEGDAQAAAFYQVFEKDPELAMFLRKLEILEETLGRKATVVLGSDTAPFDLLRGETALPKAGTKSNPEPK